jgi:hypothetical protein
LHGRLGTNTRCSPDQRQRGEPILHEAIIIHGLRLSTASSFISPRI